MTLTALLYNPLLEALVLAVALFTQGFLAAVVYRSGPKSATNRIFSLLTVCTMLWLGVIWVVRLPAVQSISLELHRLGIFFAAPMSLCFFLLGHTLPSERLRLSRPVLYLSLAATGVMMALNLSPWAFTGTGGGGLQAGIGLVPFSVVSTAFSVLAVYYLLKTWRHSSGVVHKQAGLMLLGIVLMLSLIILTILVPIALFQSTAFLPFTPLYALVFLGLTAYAITTYQLFNIKVLLTQALVVLIELVLFAKLFGEDTLDAQITDGVVLVFMLCGGYFLVRSVKREVKQRERIEQQEKQLEQVNAELQEANQNQENLIHFITHEVKGYFAKSQMLFGAIVGGDYGPVSPALGKVAAQAQGEMRTGVDTVSEILSAASLKHGVFSYSMQPLDLRAELEKAFEEFKPQAEAKGLKATLALDKNLSYQMEGDAVQLSKHVIHNLLDNALKYTQNGFVTASLERKQGSLLLSVKDSGVGLLPEDMKHLFTEGGRGKDSLKINPHSTGYGLFIAKSIVTGHQGKIWAESQGSGKGTTFFVELPVRQKPAPTQGS